MHPIEKLIADGWQRRAHKHPSVKQAMKGSFVVSHSPDDADPKWLLLAADGSECATLAMANTFNNLLYNSVGCVTVSELIGVKPRQTFVEWAAENPNEFFKESNHKTFCELAHEDVNDDFGHAKQVQTCEWDVDGWRVYPTGAGVWKCHRYIDATANSPASALDAAKRAAYRHGIGTP